MGAGDGAFRQDLEGSFGAVLRADFQELPSRFYRAVQRPRMPMMSIGACHATAKLYRGGIHATTALPQLAIVTIFGLLGFMLHL